MTKKELSQFRKNITAIVAHVSSHECVPQKLMTATRENDSSRWNEKKDRENFEASVGSYIADFGAGVRTIVKHAR